MSSLHAYWAYTNKELIELCRKYKIQRWSGKRKKDLISMILLHEQTNKNTLQEIPEESEKHEVSTKPSDLMILGLTAPILKYNPKYITKKMNPILSIIL